LGAQALRPMAAAASVIMTRILMYLKFPLLSLAGCWRLFYAVGFDRTTQFPPLFFAEVGDASPCACVAITRWMLRPPRTRYSGVRLATDV
jgi:hypothetical protein